MKLALFLVGCVIVALAVWFVARPDRDARDAVDREVIAAAAPVVTAEAMRGGDTLAPVEDAARRDVVEQPGTTSQPLVIAPTPRAAGSQTIRVRVLDRERTPLGDMPIVVSAGWPMNASELGRGRTGADGETDVTYLPAPRKDANVTVAVEGPFDPAHAFAFRASKRPSDIVELVVDRGGVLEVLVLDGARRALPGVDVRVGPRALLDLYPGWSPGAASSSMWWSLAETDAGGIARIEGVGAGLELGIQVREKHAFEALLAHATGPRAGETRRVEVAFDADDVVLVGTIALGADEPVTGWTVNLVRSDAYNPFGDWQLYPRPGEQHRFRIRVPAARLASIPHAPWLSFSDRSRPAAMFDLTSRRSPGEYDLGRILSPVGATLFAGHARHEDGTAYRGPLAIEVRPDASWFPLPGTAGVMSDEFGRFRFEGVGAAGVAWRVRPAAPGAELVGPAELAPGSEGNDLVVRSGPPPAMVRGRILLDEAGDSEGFAERLVVVVREHGAAFGHMRATPGADGTFEVGPVRRAADVLVGVPWHEGSIARVVDAVSADGAAPAGELVFDLRGRLALARVTARAPGGGAVECRLRPYDAPPATPMTDRFAGGELVVVHDTPLEVIASARGLSDVRASLVPGDNEIRFERAARPIRLVWSGAPEISAALRLKPLLVRIEDLGPPALRDMHVDFHDGAAFERGVARTVVPAPGRYAVLLQLERVETHMRAASVFKTEVPPPEIAIADSDEEVEFAVQWDAAAVLSALEGTGR